MGGWWWTNWLLKGPTGQIRSTRDRPKDMLAVSCLLFNFELEFLKGFQSYNALTAKINQMTWKVVSIYVPRTPNPGTMYTADFVHR